MTKRRPPEDRCAELVAQRGELIRGGGEVHLFVSALLPYLEVTHE